MLITQLATLEHKVFGKDGAPALICDLALPRWLAIKKYRCYATRAMITEPLPAEWSLGLIIAQFDRRSVCSCDLRHIATFRGVLGCQL